MRVAPSLPTSRNACVEGGDACQSVSRYGATYGNRPMTRPRYDIMNRAIARTAPPRLAVARRNVSKNRLALQQTITPLSPSEDAALCALICGVRVTAQNPPSTHIHSGGLAFSGAMPSPGAN